MNSAAGSPWTGSIPALTSGAHCTNSSCWAYCGLNSSVSGTKIYQISSSIIGYTSVYLTYSIGSYFLSGSDRCSVSYSVNNVDFLSIAELRGENYDSCIYTKSHCKDEVIFDGWNIDNTANLTVRIQYIGDGGSECCYFGDFVLKGVTSDPTKAQPTLSSQTTTAPNVSPSTQIPTLSPNTTINPTTSYPAPKPAPTIAYKPTYISPDVSYMSFMTIIGNYMTDEDSFTLLLMTQSHNYTDIHLMGLLESPLELNLNPSSLSSITELSEYSLCSESDPKCVKFWQIDYVQTCDSSTTLLLSGDWKAQFILACNREHRHQKTCLETLSANGLSMYQRVSLTVSNFEFEDAICEKEVYSKAFASEFVYFKDSLLLKERRNNKEYKKGDVVYMKVQVEDEENEFVINEVEINNIFICELDDELDSIVNLDEKVNEINGCLLSTNSLVIVSDATVISNGGFSFKIPNDIDVNEEKLVIQIQTTLLIQSVINHRRLLTITQAKQVRHFMTNIVLNEKSNKASAIEVIISYVGGSSVLIGILIGIILCSCSVICCVIYCCRKRKTVDVDEIMDYDATCVTCTEMGGTEKWDNKQGDDAVRIEDALLAPPTTTANIIAED